MSDENTIIRIMLVDDELEWLDRIKRSLPEYEVDTAVSYDAAMDLLRPGIPYDVAIIDLNLMEGQRDGLGESILAKLRLGYPSTRRIGLTGLPPGAVRELLERYDLDDLLLKDSLKLADVRAIVKLAEERTSSDMSADVKADRWRLLDESRAWRMVTLEWLESRLRSRQRDLSYADRDGMVNEEAQQAIHVLEDRKSTLERQCSELERSIANAGSKEDILLASEDFAQLKKSIEIWRNDNDL